MEALRLSKILLQLREHLDPAYIRNFLIIFVLYFVTGYFGLGIAPVNKFATLVWAPTGIALAAMLILGYRIWPAIWLGAFAVNFLSGAGPLVAVGIATGNTLEAVAGVYLLNLFDFDLRMSQIGDVLKLLVLGAIASTLVSALIGVGVLVAGHVITTGSFEVTWQTWWVGDMLGDLVIVPLVLSWRAVGPKILGEIDLLELTGWLAVVIVSSFYIFTSQIGRLNGLPSYAYFMFPVFVWGAVRLRQPFVSTGILLAVAISVFETVRRMGPVVDASTESRLFLLQLFMGVLAGTELILAAAAAEARLGREKERELNLILKKQVEEVERLNGLMMTYIKDNRLKRLKKVFSKQDTGGLSKG